MSQTIGFFGENLAPLIGKPAKEAEKFPQLFIEQVEDVMEDKMKLFDDTQIVL